ncbi:MAG TPA: glycosyltransferase [Bryobacteraceae bacterium]|nr:glycosyltransferase [Bryobacteraceae bacterium]HPT26913.1 glycosyltransferase [Bryobacteraceae bacterium]
MTILYHHRTRAGDAQGVHIAEMIRAFRALGHMVHIASLAGEPSARPPSQEMAKPLWQRMAQRIPGLYVALQLGYNVFGFWMLMRQVVRHHPEMIYERYSLYNFSGVLAARLFRIPIALEVNSPLALEEKSEGQSSFHWLALWTETRITNAATIVVAISGALRDILVAQGTGPDRILVLPNGISPERFKPIPVDRELAGLLGLGQRTVIGFVGWFRAWHGLEMLVDAFAQAGIAGRAVLLLVGDGPAMASLRDRIAQAGLTSSVILPGAVAHEDTPRYISLFDIAVQPAANEYCCPMKIIEYLGLGKPVIAPAQPNILELVEPGSEALVFSPGDSTSLADALRQAVDSPESLHNLKQLASTAIERHGFYWAHNAERVLEAVSATQTASTR